MLESWYEYLVQPVSELVVVDYALHMKIVVFVGKVVESVQKTARGSDGKTMMTG
jgi:hypothetical protein